MNIGVILSPLINPLRSGHQPWLPFCIEKGLNEWLLVRYRYQVGFQAGVFLFFRFCRASLPIFPLPFDLTLGEIGVSYNGICFFFCFYKKFFENTEISPFGFFKAALKAPNGETSVF